MQRKKRVKINYFNYLAMFLAVTTCPLLFMSLCKSTFFPIKFNCDDFFKNETFGKGVAVNTILLGEIHGANEHQVAECLQTLVVRGDHLLLESPAPQ